MMSVAEKILRAKGDYDAVYSAGQSSMVDESKLIPKTVSGSYISVDDVSEIPHSVACKVESVNLIDVDKLNIGYEISISAGKDMAVNDNWYTTDKIAVLPNTTYSLSGTSSRVRVDYDKNGSKISVHSYDTAEWTFTTGNDVYFVCFNSIIKGYSKPMLNKGATALPYTPYVKPEEVKVTRCGANLVTFSKKWNGTSSGVSITVNDDGSITANGAATSLRQVISENIPWTADKDTDVTIAFTDKSQSGVQASVTPRDANNVLLGTSYLTSSKTIAIPSDCRTIIVSLYITEGTTVENFIFRPMLNIGTTALPYEPYNGQTFTPKADGTVEGMTSVSPYMNIFSDTEGVNIEATYNKSYGMQTEYDKFWDVFQNNGARTSYTQAFSYARFNDTTFKPKYDLIISGGSFMFAYYNSASESTLSQYGITDLAKCLENAGVVFDTSKATNLNNLFYANQAITHIPPISFESCTALEANFYGCNKLVTIDKLIFKADGTNTISTVSYSLPFGQCSRLRNIEAEGVIGDNISFENSPLSKASITSVIDALSNSITGKTLRLRLSAVNTAFETSGGVADGSTSEEFAALVATKTNWTITMV